MSVTAYLEKVRKKYATGEATEHSYRSALEELFESIAPEIAALNEPKRVACGAPDFIITRKAIPIGHCEAKDLHIDLGSMKDANLNQKKRYLKALPNLIYTNGLDFEFWRNGEKVGGISIAILADGKIEAIPAEFETLTNQLAAFAAEKPQTITSAKKLAEMMAGKAVLIKDIMGNALKADAMFNTELVGQYQAFKTHLIHDIDPNEFADIYAETIAYGLFAARLHDTSLATFSRTEALELLPKSNPFLRSLFGYIAGVDLDDRIRWVIDELADVFQACDLHELMKDFGRFTARNDPFLHFYETFLAEYNPAKRKARGVWYTPEPVVNFIVRAVDDMLKTEFNLPLGLADTSKITIPWDTGQTDAKGNRTTIQKQVHRVQILDPATGTGTFLAEAIKQIAAQVKPHAEGLWSNYVEQDLIPRLHGFELLMASYAMCHMKLDMMLTEMGYKPSGTPPRLGVYLTNSLEEGEQVSQNLFAQWLANEAKSASEIKQQMPIMCVIGNPPYSGESANKGDWIMGLMEAYKKEPGGKVRLDERNPKWINDDYVKFIRFAEHMIEKNGEGILGFITNHGYLDNPTFRGMRWHLLDTFDKIYVLDLHGNAKKKEVSPDGSADKNVFDIQQGVAIVIAVKKKAKGQKGKALAEVFHSEVWGGREAKYGALWDGNLGALTWNAVQPRSPHFVFIDRNENTESAWLQGFPINSFMGVNSVGVVTSRDALTIDENKEKLWARLSDFAQLDPELLRSKYDLGADVTDWTVAGAKADVTDSPDRENIRRINYRPFDKRWTYYTGIPNGFHCRPRRTTMAHFFDLNLGLATARSNKNPIPDHFLVSDSITEAKFAESSTQSALFPLYLYPEPGCLETERRVNFDPKIYAAISEVAGLAPSPPSGGEGQTARSDVRERGAERATASVVAPSPPSPSLAAPAYPSPPEGGEGIPDELRVFDYIYGVLHSLDYRRTYAQFLKIDFPRIPYPASPEIFAHVAEKGGQLRRLHLMEDAAIGATPYPFKGEGAGEVVKPELTDDGRVLINPNQWFEGVPRIAWEFHIGGYQPAQKWLKDRKGRTLSFEDVMHYQKIIKILVETDRIMKEIELPLR